MASDMQSPTFCILPWVHRFTNIGGEVQVCCSSEEYDNSIRDNNNQKINIRDQVDDEQIMNSQFMKNLRLQMLAGKWPKICTRCQVTEESKGQSRRQAENIHFASHIKEKLASIAKDGSIPVQVVSSDFRLGNLCNLACRMCSPRSSTKWLTEYPKSQHGIEFSSEQLKEFRHFDWYKAGRLENYAESQIATLEHLHFAGGEPLLVPQMLSLLRLCVDSGHSKHIELTYNTNLTFLPEEVKKLWPHFRSVQLFCSVDAFGNLNDYIRYPSDWKTVDANLKDIDRNHKNYGISLVNLMCTFQVYNVLHLKDFFDYAFATFSFVSQIPITVDLHFPFCMRASVLPRKLKDTAIDRLLRLEETTALRLQRGLIPPEQERYLEYLRGSINFLKSEDSHKHWDELVAVTSSTDRVRAECVKRVIPEFEPYFPSLQTLRI